MNWLRDQRSDDENPLKRLNLALAPLRLRGYLPAGARFRLVRWREVPPRARYHSPPRAKHHSYRKARTGLRSAARADWNPAVSHASRTDNTIASTNGHSPMSMR